MSSKTANNWARAFERICAGDVLAWCRTIREDHNLWVRFGFSPPLPSQEGKNWGTVVLWLESHVEGQLWQKVVAQRSLQVGSKLTLEEVMLSLVSDAAMQLDRRAWEEERARLDLMALFDQHNHKS